MKDLEQITARQLEVFSVLMTSKGLKESALRLNCSMAAISKTIKSLEQITQVELFTQIGNRLQPTQAAKQLLPMIQHSLRQFDLARHAFLTLGKQQQNYLRIGVGGGALPALVPQAIKHFKQSYPEIRFEIISEPTQKLLNLISNHQLDLAIATPAPQDTAPEILALCHIHELTETALVAAVHHHHPLASKNLITPHDLADQKLITIYSSSPTTLMLHAAFREHQIEPHLDITVSNSTSACYLIQAQLGIGLIHPEALATDAFPTIQRIAFAPRISMRTYAYVPQHKSDLSIVELFLKSIKTILNLETHAP
ncbi:LysR family transcriptional regulator [Acinetobacter ihumii]|uniref:LysR family transcriptional regulator n=1 Tax=Acinetobacter ihumii TaxID=2483802 RepID=UPI0013EF506E|nr:LysR family transcriptional regulator [Acinetobacter ihumii]